MRRWSRQPVKWHWLLGLLALLVLAAGAQSYLRQPGDLLDLRHGTGQTPASAPVQQHSEPRLTATPRIACARGSHPLAGVDGRVTAAALKASPRGGYTCNLTVVSHQGYSGGFKVFRYVDRAGHVCAFYDTALLFPTNAFNAGGNSLGVKVLDMANPAHPKRTDTLTSLPMMTPHESLNLSPRRGLLAAVSGNPGTLPGVFSVYDVSRDCRHPVPDAVNDPVARLGHESGFSPDGRTFYAAGTSWQSITAIDLTNPTIPKPIWQGVEYSHGMTIGDDGKRAYIADPINATLLILDISQIQSRKPSPKAREISRLRWNSVTIPQNAMPMRINGHHYLLEFDEYAFRFKGAPPDTVGAGRIINIDNERRPYVVSNLRLQVDQRKQHHLAASRDPGQIDPAQGYAAHYCAIPREVNPQIVACSFISSGLRVFDIRDPRHPREIAYFVAPRHPAIENGFDGSNFAMSKPAFDPARREIWYTDGARGFYVVRVFKNLWPNP